MTGSRPRAPEVHLWVALVLGVLAALPVALAHYPQMVDYPAHVARYAVMLDQGRNPWFSRYYGFEWKWTGNVGGDLLIWPLARLFGLELGGKVMLGLIVAASGVGVVLCEWVLRRRIGVGTLLGLCFVWSPVMSLGFVNYTLGQAVGFMAFALWYGIGGQGRLGRFARWRPLFLAVAALLVWLGHISAWAVLVVMVAGADFSLRLGQGWRQWWRSAVVPLPLFTPVIVMILIPGTSSENSYGKYWWAYKKSTWERAMRDTNWWLDHVSLWGVGVAIGLAILLTGLSFALRRWKGGWWIFDGRSWFDGRLGWAGAGLLILSWIVPRHISQGDLADYRLITTGLMVCAMAIDWAPRWWAMSPAFGLYAMRLATTTMSWQQDSDDTAEILKALDFMPDGAKVASVVLTPREYWWFNKQEHVAAYAVWRRHALVNVNFALAHIHMLKVKEGGPGFADPSHRLLQTIKVPVRLDCIKPAYHADWLWYVGAPTPETWPDGAKVAWHGRDVWLAHVPNPGVVPARCNKKPEVKPGDHPVANGEATAPLAKTGFAH